MFGRFSTRYFTCVLWLFVFTVVLKWAVDSCGVGDSSRFFTTNLGTSSAVCSPVIAWDSNARSRGVELAVPAGLFTPLTVTSAEPVRSKSIQSFFFQIGVTSLPLILTSVPLDSRATFSAVGFVAVGSVIPAIFLTWFSYLWETFFPREQSGSRRRVTATYRLISERMQNYKKRTRR